MRLLIGIHAMGMTVLSVFFSAFATVAFRTLDWKLITKVSAAFGKLSNALSPASPSTLCCSLHVSHSLSLTLFVLLLVVPYEQVPESMLCLWPGKCCLPNVSVTVIGLEVKPFVIIKGFQA